MPSLAISIEECMEQRCIDYFNKWQAMVRGKRADAMTVLAELYYQGHGTNKNLKKSIQYFRKASIYQSAYAQRRDCVTTPRQRSGRYISDQPRPGDGHCA